MNRTINSALPKDLNLPRVRQIGIVVNDMERALKHYRSLFNIKSWYSTYLVEKEIYFHSQKIDMDLDIYLGYSGSLQVELIKVNSGDPNIYDNLVLQKKDGIHHLGFFVRDFDEKMAKFSEAGVQATQSGLLRSRGGSITRFAYLDTVEYCGIITEIIETKLMGIYVGMSKIMMQLGRVTGDVSKYKISHHP